MKELKNHNYRVCYDNGNSITGEKVYELYKYCDCSNCSRRMASKREPANRVTATTKEIAKVDDVAVFLKNWTCENGSNLVDTEYIQF